MRLHVLRNPVMRRFVPAVGVSALGDGMSMVAVAWLALQIAPESQKGMWTALAVTAFSLPATLGAYVFRKAVSGWPGARLVAGDATLRAVLLGLVAVLAIADALSPLAYVIILGASSLMHAWGSAGVYTIVAEALPSEAHLTGNSLISSVVQIAFVIGPAAAGALMPFTGPGWVLAIDAVSYAILAAISWRLPGKTRDVKVSASLRLLSGYPQIVAITVVFFFLYGPVEVALPIHVAQQAGAAMLGLFWTCFGIGAGVGALLATRLRNSSLWTVVAAIIIGWGASLLPVGLSQSLIPGLIGFAVGGVIYGPYTSVTTALLQSLSPPDQLSRVLAARNALTIPATSLGALAGGPAVNAFGAQKTLLLSGFLTIGLGLAVLAFTAARTRTGPPAPDRSVQASPDRP
ncbi:MAG TPA: MFS transporter [Candidatus Limnocylindrales bacterium]